MNKTLQLYSGNSIDIEEGETYSIYILEGDDPKAYIMHVLERIVEGDERLSPS